MSAFNPSNIWQFGFAVIWGRRGWRGHGNNVDHESASLEKAKMLAWNSAVGRRLMLTLRLLVAALVWVDWIFLY